MCRIFGHFDAHVTPHEIKAVAALQRHGGPDAQTHAAGDSWGLGNNRLAIMDLDGGEQPYALDGIVAVFNGEIYNHDELRRTLIARGHRFEDTCDGSIIPALYAEYGTGFTEHLDGMYAVAVMDLRREPTLVLATDDVGMKPLYYHWDAALGHLYFSSELPALLSYRAVGTSFWEPGLEAYLATKTPFGEQTMFADVKILPPATTARLDRSHGLRLHRRTVAVDPLGQADETAAAEHLQDLLRQEVHRLTTADVPVAAVTSGGLDSSLVTALAAEQVGELHTFNIAYRGTWPSDERGFARQVAELHGTRHHQIEIDPATFPDLLSDMVWHLGQPNADPITLSTYALFDAVHQAGFKVAVTGDAADELFGGYDRIRAAMRAPADGWIPGYVRALTAVPKNLRTSLYSPDYHAFVSDHGFADDAIAEQLHVPGRDRLDTITDFEVGSRLPAYHLRRVDHLSMASSVEVRLPFCQPSVVRYARALPAAWKVDGNRGKQVLYAAADGLLPESVLNRPKQPFTLPITAMLAPGQPLMAFARDMLAPQRLRRHGRLDPVAVARLLQGQQDSPADDTALAVWSLLVHELWLDQFHGTPHHTGLSPTGARS